MENETRPHFKPGSVAYTKGYGFRLFISKILNMSFFIMSTILVLSSIYVLVEKPVKTEDGLVFINQTSGSIAVGSEVLVDNGKINNNLFTPFVRFFKVQDVYYAEVLAGPYGELNEVKGAHQVSVENQVTLVNLEDVGDGFLDEEYIVRKTDGQLENQKDEIVESENIIGLKK